MSNTATVITTKAGEALIAQMQAENKVLVIDKFIFANVPNRPAFPDRDDVVPVEHVVHESAVHEQGRLTENSVIYSTTLASNVGPFSFNWSGLFCSEHNVLVAINFPPPVDKTVDAPGITGNTLVRSFVLEYKGISETTNITVDPSSWQYDAHKRMSKMDNDTAQAIIDQNGKDWFIDDGFIVTPQSGAYSIKAGAGYVSGHRISLDFDRIIQVPEKPAFIYVDTFREGSPTGEWQTKFTFVVAAEEKDDYTDAQGVNHFVCKIAQVFEDGSVSMLRKKDKVGHYVDSINNLHTTRDAIEWRPNLKVKTKDALQLFSHTDEHGVKSYYLPNVDELPFVTGDSWDSDVTLSLFIEDRLHLRLPDFKSLQDAIVFLQSNPRPENSTVEWNGYWVVVDGGAGRGVIKHGNVVGDGGSQIRIDDNFYIEQDLTNGINVKQWGGKGIGESFLDTPYAQNAVNYFEKSSMTFSKIYGGEVYFSAGEWNLKGLQVNRVGTELVGQGEYVTRFCGYAAGVMITVRPLLNGSPYTGLGFGGFKIRGIKLYAANEAARTGGIGMQLISCFTFDFTNFRAEGFHQDVNFGGCHYPTFTSCYLGDISDDGIDPSEKIFNRGKTLVADPAEFVHEPVSSGLSMRGCTLNNTSVDLRNMANYTIDNCDLEPASNSYEIRDNSTWRGCRMENFEQYAIGGEYPRFTWFIITGNNNKFKDNVFHWSGHNNNLLVNPIFHIAGNNNYFDFRHYPASNGLFNLVKGYTGNTFILNNFEDYKLSTSAPYPQYYIENVMAGIAKPHNSYTLNELSSSVAVNGFEIKVSGCLSIDMPTKTALLQGCTKNGNTYTIVNDGSGNKRIIYSYGETALYEEGVVYCFKCKITCPETVGFRFTPDYVSAIILNYTDCELVGSYLCWRFYIPAGQSERIQPTLLFEGNVGDVFFIEEIELLKMSAGKYVENIYDCV